MLAGSCHCQHDKSILSCRQLLLSTVFRIRIRIGSVFGIRIPNADPGSGSRGSVWIFFSVRTRSGFNLQMTNALILPFKKVFKKYNLGLAARNCCCVILEKTAVKIFLPWLGFGSGIRNPGSGIHIQPKSWIRIRIQRMPIRNTDCQHAK